MIWGRTTNSESRTNQRNLLLLPRRVLSCRSVHACDALAPSHHGVNTLTCRHLDAPLAVWHRTAGGVRCGGCLTIISRVFFRAIAAILHRTMGRFPHRVVFKCFSLCVDVRMRSAHREINERVSPMRRYPDNIRSPEISMISRLLMVGVARFELRGISFLCSNACFAVRKKLRIYKFLYIVCFCVPLRVIV